MHTPIAVVLGLLGASRALPNGDAPRGKEVHDHVQRGLAGAPARNASHHERWNSSIVRKLSMDSSMQPRKPSAGLSESRHDHDTRAHSPKPHAAFGSGAASTKVVPAKPEQTSTTAAAAPQTADDARPASMLVPVLTVLLVAAAGAVMLARKHASAADCVASLAGAIPLSAQDVGFLLSALVLNTLVAPMVKLTQNGHGGYDFNQSCVYFFAEALKFAVAAVALRDSNRAAKTLAAHAARRLRTSLPHRRLSRAHDARSRHRHASG